MPITLNKSLKTLVSNCHRFSALQSATHAMETNDIQIRRAQLHDASEMARLADELGYPTRSEQMEARLAQLLEDMRHYVVVADGGSGQILGWMHVEHRVSLVGGGTAELMGLIVDARAHRRGVGRALVAVAECWAVERGLHKLTVRSNTERGASHPFYDALGYARTKTQHVYGKRIASPSPPGDADD